MSTFDPETGARIRGAIVTAESGGRTRTPWNPYVLALGLIWVLSAVVACVLLASGLVALSPDEIGGTDRAPGLFAAAGIFGVVAIVAGVVHLGVRAVAWRPPED